jgi:hypothetical protein
MLAALDATRKRVEERQAEIPGRLRNYRNFELQFRQLRNRPGIFRLKLRIPIDFCGRLHDEKQGKDRADRNRQPRKTLEEERV